MFSDEKPVDCCTEIWVSKGRDQGLLFLKIFFHSFVCVCVFVNVCRVFMGDRRPGGMRFPAAGVSGSLEMFDVGAGN